MSQKIEWYREQLAQLEILETLARTGKSTCLGRERVSLKAGWGPHAPRVRVRRDGAARSRSLLRRRRWGRICRYVRVKSVEDQIEMRAVRGHSVFPLWRKQNALDEATAIDFAERQLGEPVVIASVVGFAAEQPSVCLL